MSSKVTVITPPVEKRYSIEVSEVEKELIASALTHFRNLEYYCRNNSKQLITDAFRGQTSLSKATLAIGIIQAIRSE